MVGLKYDHICKHLTQNGEPQRYSWETRRRGRSSLVQCSLMSAPRSAVLMLHCSGNHSADQWLIPVHWVVVPVLSHSGETRMVGMKD